MPILTILLVLVVVGVILWLVDTYIPLQPAIKKIINIVMVVVLTIWLLQIFGAWHYLSQARI